MNASGLPEIEDRHWLHVLDDAALLLQLISALEPPAPETLPLPAGDGTEYFFESPMTESQALDAIELMKHCAVRIAVLQAGFVLKSLCASPDRCADSMVHQAIKITGLIGDAYGDDPYNPVWRLEPRQVEVSFSVPNVISLDLSGLDGRPVRLLDFGGTESILKLLAFTRGCLQENQP